MITIKNSITGEIKFFDNPASCRIFLKNNTEWFVKNTGGISPAEMWCEVNHDEK